MYKRWAERMENQVGPPLYSYTCWPLPLSGMFSSRVLLVNVYTSPKPWLQKPASWSICCPLPRVGSTPLYIPGSGRASMTAFGTWHCSYISQICLLLDWISASVAWFIPLSRAWNIIGAFSASVCRINQGWSSACDDFYLFLSLQLSTCTVPLGEMSTLL